MSSKEINLPGFVKVVTLVVFSRWKKRDIKRSRQRISEVSGNNKSEVS